jgi:hypothetical protein
MEQINELFMAGADIIIYFIVMVFIVKLLFSKKILKNIYNGK